MQEIVSLDAKPVVLYLRDSFHTSIRKADTSETVLIRLQLRNGVIGFGESVPLKYISGETINSVLGDIERAGELLNSRPISSFRKIITEMNDVFSGHSSVLAGIEMAVIDAFCKYYNLPAWQFLGGFRSCIRTDVTISLTHSEKAVSLAAKYCSQGFSCIKIKVSQSVDASYLLAISESAPAAYFIIDANQSFDKSSAVDFIKSLPFDQSRIAVFEQPVAQNDFGALKSASKYCGVPVYADESAKNTADCFKIAKMSAADGINIKIQKQGVIGAIESTAICRSARLKVMLGCMLESAIGLSASAHLACGLGCFEYLDLDSDVLLEGDIGRSGFIRKGSEIAVLNKPGFGAEPPEGVFD